MNRTRKTYLRTNTLRTSFPSDFLVSENKKYIVVRYCKATFWNGEQDYLVGNICVHADFVQRDAYLDHFICFANEYPGKYVAKLEYLGNFPQEFNIWFSDMSGNQVTPSAFLLDLLLIY